MSTKASIKWRHQAAGLPGFHLYDDVLDSFGSETNGEPPVYLRLDGVAAQMETLPTGGAAVTVVLPREAARELGLLPTETSSGGDADSTR